MTIQAGQLKKRVAIDQPINTQNETGEEITDWELVGTFWARIHPLNGREALQANVNISEMDTRITLRWSSVLDVMTTGWRIRFKDTIYDLKSVLTLELARREIEVMAKSGVNLG